MSWIEDALKERDKERERQALLKQKSSELIGEIFQAIQKDIQVINLEYIVAIGGVSISQERKADDLIDIRQGSNPICGIGISLKPSSSEILISPESLPFRTFRFEVSTDGVVNFIDDIHSFERLSQIALAPIFRP